jgi:hypothetical protein
MPLFQKSVISKYLKAQNKEHLNSKWKSYSDHFLNPRVQEEIKGLKEEQYQGEFLEDLFEDIKYWDTHLNIPITVKKKPINPCSINV